MTPAGDVRHDESQRRFEIAADGGTAFLSYTRNARAILFLHTEVPPQAEGKGIGGKLVRAGLEYAREQGLRVIPLCPFVAAYIRRHKEYLEDVPIEHRDKVTAPNPNPATR